MSEQEWSFFDALVSALAAIEDVTKGRQAKVAMKGGGEYRYSYSNIDDVLDAVKPCLAAHGLAVMQNTRGGPGGIGVQTIVIGKDGSRMESDWLDLKGGTAQECGSAITYARRYSLQSFLGIATDDDDGAAASRPAPARQQPQQASAPQRPVVAPRTHEEAAMRDLIATVEQPTRDQVIRAFKREFGATLQDLAPEHHERAHVWLEGQIARAQLAAQGIQTDDAPHPSD